LLIICGCTALALSSCIIVVDTDITVTWTVNNSTSPSACASYGIATWVYRVEGVGIVGDVICQTEAWTSGNVFYGLDEGSYTITVEARDSVGALLASQSRTVSTISLPGITENFNFTDASFTAGP
jgi:hypothetical protein